MTVCFQVMTVENSSTHQSLAGRDEGIKWIPGRREQRAGGSPAWTSARLLGAPPAPKPNSSGSDLDLEILAGSAEFSRRSTKGSYFLS